MTPENYDIARHWLLTSLGTGRDFLVLKQDQDWLKALNPRQVPVFTPTKIAVYQVPKSGNQVRDVPYLSIQERLYVTASLIAQYKDLKRGINFHDIDFWSPLPMDPEDTSWINSFYEEHKKFRLRRENQVANGKFVWQGDIEGFGNHVQERYLQTALRDMGVSDVSRQVISEHLSRLRQAGIKGLAQGTVITDILSKVYLAPLDQKMASALGMNNPNEHYYRYYDDLVLTADSENELTERRRILTNALGQIGLKLNPSKSVIIRPGDHKAANPLRDAFTQAAHNLKVKDFDFDRSAEAKTFPPEILHHVFNTAVQDPTLPHSIFNFTLHRMATAHNPFAVDVLPEILEKYPERANEVFRYAAALNFSGEIPDRIQTFFTGPKDRLPYLGYQFAHAVRVWRTETSQQIPGALRPALNHLRAQARSRTPFMTSGYDQVL